MAIWIHGLGQRELTQFVWTDGDITQRETKLFTIQHRLNKGCVHMRPVQCTVQVEWMYCLSHWVTSPTVNTSSVNSLSPRPCIQMTLHNANKNLYYGAIKNLWTPYCWCCKSLYCLYAGKRRQLCVKISEIDPPLSWLLRLQVLFRSTTREPVNKSSKVLNIYKFNY